MFRADFYRAVLPDRVERECAARTSHVPVVGFHLADGVTLDVCHIVHLADTWLAVATYRDSATCEEMDFAFMSYESVVRITLSLQDPKARRLGFNPAASRKSTDSFSAGDALVGHSLPGGNAGGEGKVD